MIDINELQTAITLEAQYQANSMGSYMTRERYLFEVLGNLLSDEVRALCCLCNVCWPAERHRRDGHMRITQQEAPAQVVLGWRNPASNMPKC